LIIFIMIETYYDYLILDEIFYDYLVVHRSVEKISLILLRHHFRGRLERMHLSIKQGFDPWGSS
jgi:hypothetical protein